MREHIVATEVGRLAQGDRRVKRRAFTLVELLVVVAIIALLVSILMPSLSRAKNLARVTICACNMSVAGRGVLQYEADLNAAEPWMYSNGADLPWEGLKPKSYDKDGRMVPWSWGNPAIALTRDFGKTMSVEDDGISYTIANPQNFMDDARPLFCPLAAYNYQDHYRRHGLQGLPLDSLPYVWGTSQWVYSATTNHDGSERVNADVIREDALMLDYIWYVGPNPWEQYKPPSFWHFNALLRGGSVVRLPNTVKGAWEWLYGPQPSGVREVGYYGVTRELQDVVPDQE
jgi:prepilin-type N-terminal cleavage/methylation domain-containing protein